MRTLRHPMILVILSLLTLAACDGCTGLNPSGAAKTSEQQAYAIYGQFVITEEAAATINEDPGVPPAVKSAIAQADARAKPAADSLISATRNLLVIRSEVSSGKTTEDKLTVATANLDRWVSESRPLIESFVTAVTKKE